MTTPELVDKLDTDVVNGPQDDNPDWDTIWWRPVEDDVRRLRRRIFKAPQDGDLKRGRRRERSVDNDDVDYAVIQFDKATVVPTVIVVEVVRDGLGWRLGTVADVQCGCASRQAA